MQLTHFYHRHQLHRLSAHPDFYFFELAIWLHTVARSLTAVFIPILLFQSGYSISAIILFYLIYIVIDVPLNFAVDRLIRKIGARKVMILGTVASIAFFGLLSVLPPANWVLLFLLALLAAVYDTLFWIAHIYIFIEANREGLDTGKSVGALAGVRRLAQIVGPFIGAFILLSMGKVPLIMASILIFMFSIIALFKMRHVRDLPQEKKLSFRGFFAAPQEKRTYLSWALLGIHSEVDEILWPLFIFTLFGTVESVAAVPIIASLSTALFSYFAGKLTKRYGTRMIIVGALVIACAWILRLTIQDPTLYYITIFIVGIFSLLVSLPLDVAITTRGLAIDSLSASTYRNTISMAPRAVLYGILAVLVEVFRVSFGLAASSLFLIVFVVLLLGSKINSSKETRLVSQADSPS